MTGMFQECNELEYLDLSNFNTSKVTTMEAMFNQCRKLKEIKGINNFNTNNVTNMRVMFQECNELEYLDLSNFNTSNVIDMRAMFRNCYKLSYLNLESFTINDKCLIDHIFLITSYKCNIIIKDGKLKNIIKQGYIE